MNKTKQLKKWTTATSALDVAQYLLSLDPQRKYFTKKQGNMRLNTLLHILQILHYAKFQKMLFKEDLIAVSPNFWQNQAEQQKLLTKWTKK